MCTLLGDVVFPQGPSMLKQNKQKKTHVSQFCCPACFCSISTGWSALPSARAARLPSFGGSLGRREWCCSNVMWSQLPRWIWQMAGPAKQRIEVESLSAHSVLKVHLVPGCGAKNGVLIEVKTVMRMSHFSAPHPSAPSSSDNVSAARPLRQ